MVFFPLQVYLFAITTILLANKVIANECQAPSWNSKPNRTSYSDIIERGNELWDIQLTKEQVNDTFCDLQSELENSTYQKMKYESKNATAKSTDKTFYIHSHKKMQSISSDATSFLIKITYRFGILQHVTKWERQRRTSFPIRMEKNLWKKSL
jgi:hypothetical protein